MADENEEIKKRLTKIEYLIALATCSILLFVWLGFAGILETLGNHDLSFKYMLCVIIAFIFIIISSVLYFGKGNEISKEANK